MKILERKTNLVQCRIENDENHATCVHCFDDNKGPSADQSTVCASPKWNLCCSSTMPGPLARGHFRNVVGHAVGKPNYEVWERHA